MMQSDFLPFSRPALDHTDLEAVQQVLLSGWITTGPKTNELEQVFVII
ncbi:hypothetical protein P4S72_19730 [Vibrio sp. PP-XX7]